MSKKGILVSSDGVTPGTSKGIPEYNVPDFTNTLVWHIVDASLPRRAMSLIRDLASIQEFYAIVVCGGDELVHEVVNGLLTRKDWELAIKIPIAVLPLPSNTTPTTLAQQTPQQAVRSLLEYLSYPSSSSSTTSHTRLTYTSPIQALTTLSGLRIFSHAYIHCQLVQAPPPLCESSSSFSLLSPNLASPASSPFSFSYLPINAPNRRRNRSPSPDRTCHDNNGNEDSMFREIVGPVLLHFADICTRVLRRGNLGVLPAGWESRFVNVAAKGKKRKLFASQTATAQYETWFYSEPRCSKGGQALDVECGAENDTETKRALCAAVCLHPPLVVDEERPRVRHMVVDGVQLHETRGFSVEILEGISVTFLGTKMDNNDERANERSVDLELDGFRVRKRAMLDLQRRNIDSIGEMESDDVPKTPRNGVWGMIVVGGLVLVPLVTSLMFGF